MARSATLLFALAALALLAAPPAACASAEDPAPAPQDPAEEAAAREFEAAAAAAREAREKAVKAAEEATEAERKALRARRRSLEASVAAKEAELDRLRADGKKVEASVVEAELARLYQEMVQVAAKLAGGVRPGMPAGRARGAVVPGLPSHLTAGLPPLQPRTEAKPEAGAVEAALDWLARHQSPDGSFDCDGFSALCREGKCPGAGGPLFDPGVTGLAVLPFLGVGETHKTPKHGETVRNALKYLQGVQDAEGCFGPRTSNHFVYNHALGTLAMAEAYGLTSSPLFKESAQQGVDFALRCRNPYLAWRYGVRPQDNDTAVTGWMVMALRSAKTAGLEVDDQAFQGAIAWLDKVTEPGYGRVGYTARGNGPARPQELMDRFPADRSESLTAEGILARVLCGQGPENEWVQKGADLCLRCPPRWDAEAGTIDFYYWYFGTLAQFQVGGDRWKQWSEALGQALPPWQRGEDSGCARGSFDPVDPWGVDGGRVYATAINACTLEVRLRYGKAFGGK